MSGLDQFYVEGVLGESAGIAETELSASDQMQAEETGSSGKTPIGWYVGGIESDDSGLSSDGAVIFITDSIEAGGENIDGGEIIPDDLAGASSDDPDTDQFEFKDDTAEAEGETLGGGDIILVDIVGGVADAEGGNREIGGDYILVDIVGTCTEEPIVDDFVFG